MWDEPCLPAVRRQRLWPPVTDAKASEMAGGDHGGGGWGYVFILESFTYFNSRDIYFRPGKSPK